MCFFGPCMFLVANPRGLSERVQGIFESVGPPGTAWGHQNSIHIFVRAYFFERPCILGQSKMVFQAELGCACRTCSPAGGTDMLLL